MYYHGKSGTQRAETFCKHRKIHVHLLTQNNFRGHFAAIQFSVFGNFSSIPSASYESNLIHRHQGYPTDRFQHLIAFQLSVLLVKVGSIVTNNMLKINAHFFFINLFDQPSKDYLCKIPQNSLANVQLLVMLCQWKNIITLV
ncbi:hypothetical protein BpHYR1_053400 [Brachionus plicatilis]|uniref:Uncharacterized protein n=1 Tax=Brachionus plicatilis TaxID=10195 RepID=A0A3M7QY27_BRAPC|nr:hypothetical protein BpHYR1_053400 [Brachionus plicatilis]